MPQKAKAKIVKDVTQLVLARRTKMCNFLEYKGTWVSVALGARFSSSRFRRPDDAFFISIV